MEDEDTDSRAAPASKRDTMVKATLTSGCRRVDVGIDNIGAILESFTEAAERMERSQRGDAVDGTKKCFKKMLEAQAKLQAFRMSMQKLEATYSEPPVGEETDFKDILREGRDTRFEESNFDAEQHDVYKKLLADLKDVHSDEEDDEAAPADEDDDLQIEHGSRSMAPNVRCPVTGTELLELKDPVQDQKGFVYERQAIVDYIARQGEGGVVNAPVSGATHQIKVSDLSAARKVLKQKKKAAKQPAQTQRADEDEIHNV